MKKVLLLVLSIFFGAQTAQATDDVKAWLYSTPMGQDCDQGDDSWVSEQAAEKYEVTYQNTWDDSEVTYTFYSVLCYAGAYNFTSLFVYEDEYTPGGYSIISFSEPFVNYVMIPGESEEFGPIDVLQSWSLEGFYANNYLTNAWFDEETKTITTHAKGRGIGDAFSSNTYTFRRGAWLLTKAVADPTFDGKITPITVFEVE